MRGSLGIPYTRVHHDRLFHLRTLRLRLGLLLELARPEPCSWLLEPVFANTEQCAAAPFLTGWLVTFLLLQKLLGRQAVTMRYLICAFDGRVIFLVIAGEV